MWARSLNPEARPFLRLAAFSFLLLLASLSWMQAPLKVRGLDAFPMDLLYILAAGSWLVALVRGETDLRWHRGFLLLATYFLAMMASALVSPDPERSAFKLLTQAYLLSLPILVFNLVRTLADLRRAVMWWVAGAGAVALLGAATLLLFPILGPDSALDGLLHGFGTLPPGPYPRLELTFLFPAMLANYLGVSLMLVLIGSRLGWFRRGPAMALGAALFATALFALTPGFGGVLFSLGAWFWYVRRDTEPHLARAALFAGCAMPVIGVAIATISPMIYATAPYMIDVPGTSIRVAPSVRLLAWTDAVRNFAAAPIFGHGIGVDPVTVAFQVKDCSEGCIDDAHNTFLNFAPQAGLVGLAAMLAIIWSVAKNVTARRDRTDADSIVVGLSFAWIGGFVMQGLVGSFEDARHLWIILGLILSAEAAGVTEGSSNPRIIGDKIRIN